MLISSAIRFKTLFHFRAFLSPFVRAWNPYFFPFIVGKRHRYAVIDTDQFTLLFKSTFAFLRQTALNGGRYFYFNPFQPKLFVFHPFGLELSRWTPGLFTNKFVMRRIRALDRMPFFFPSALFLLSLGVKNVSFAKEAKRLLIPTIAMMGAYFNHRLIDYPILSNPTSPLATYILEVTKQMYNNLYWSWALDYSVMRNKFARMDKTKQLFFSSPNAVQLHKEVVEKNKATPMKKQKSSYLSYNFRHFRVFSDRYKKVWKLLYGVNFKKGFKGKVGSKRFSKKFSRSKNGHNVKMKRFRAKKGVKASKHNAFVKK
jgi:hypothetical protein